jgi:putative ABC transport system permease protein
LTESLALAMIAGAIGLALGEVVLTLLLSVSPADITGLGNIGLNPHVLAFTTLLSVLTAAICGFVPAMQSANVDLEQSLKNDGKQTGRSARTRILFQTFVATQIAIAVVLLAGAGLMLRSLSNLAAVDPGFDATNLLTFQVSLPRNRYHTDYAVLQFYSQLMRKIEAVPEVRAAGAVSFLPLSGMGAATDYKVVGEAEPEAGKGPVVDMRVANDGYFAAMKIPLLRGRMFSEREQLEKSEPVTIINEAMGRQLGGNPIGRRIVFAYGTTEDTHTPFEVIGVVGDVKHTDLTTTPRAMAYWTHTQIAIPFMTVTVRTKSEPLNIVPAVNSVVRSIDKDLPVSDLLSMEQWVAKSTAQTRFNSALLSAFGAVALALAAIGVYGVLSYSVSTRSVEIAVRVALGARRNSVVGMIIRDGITVVAVGMLAGVPLSLVLNRSLRTLLYNVTGADPLTFATVVAVLSGVAVVASYLPARRASRIAPAEALRHQ